MSPIIRDVIASIREAAAEEAPPTDAPASDHLIWLNVQILNGMLTVRFWLFVLLVAATVAALDWWL